MVSRNARPDASLYPLASCEGIIAYIAQTVKSFLLKFVKFARFCRARAAFPYIIRYVGHSISFPSVVTVTTRQGMNFPLASRALLTAFSIPEQQGTSILTTVTLFISLFAIMAVSFSE